MKTAMQELIEWVETRDMRNYQNKYAFRQGVLAKINKAFEKEKEQMIDFAMQMHKIDCSKTGTDLLFDEAESYYNQTYNQNK